MKTKVRFSCFCAAVSPYHLPAPYGAGGLLGISWHDTQWIPILNAGNILDYFSERSNPFYDKTCNNEIIKMQRLSPSHLNSMDGMEYILLHVQEPILYVIRKQHRHASAGGQVTPIADYYCVAGVVYQAPDLGSIVNSRLMNTINHLQSAFTECLSYTRYHPSKGYSWEFNTKEVVDDKTKKKENKVKEEPSSVFQRVRVDILLGELSKKYATRIAAPPQQQQMEPVKPTPAIEDANSSNAVKVEGKENVRIKQEPNTSQQNPPQQRMKPPPEKKPRLM